MRRIFILVLCIFMTFCTGCSRIVASSADELTLGTWKHENENKMSASLEFNEEKAKLTITSSGDEAHTIEGTYSVDSENIYITDTSKCKTYTFSYEVYADRVYLGYMGNTIKFERKK